jgi:hypothetical protein
VPSGTHVTYTVTVTLSAGQAQALTIQLRGDSNIINRTLTCTSSSNGNADQTGPAGAPSCMWLGPIVAGTFTFVFGGDMNASIADAVPAAVSVVCTDTNSTNTCNDELLSDQVPLTDLTGDVGPVSVGSAPAAASEVNQTPPGGSTVGAGTHVTYTATVVLSSGQAQPVTIQLRGDPNITNRTLTCTSTTNGSAAASSSLGNPSCSWAGPVVAGTFMFVFGGDVSGIVGDAVPDPLSVICSDTNLTNSCEDEAAGVKVALADASGDVGPLALRPPPGVTSEVNQVPNAGSTVVYGGQVAYTATVVLSTPQPFALTIQLRGDASIANRTLACTSSSNGAADVTGPAGNPSCMWNGPLVAGTFTFVFGGVLTGSVGDAVPDAASLVCADTNASNTCSDEAPGDTVPLADANGDVGPLIMTLSHRRTLPMVSRD